MIPNTPLSTKSIVNLSSYKYITPANYKPIITEQDYERGYITRFFVGKINYFDVYETNNKEYKLANSIYYNKAKVDWKITGPEFNIFDGKILQTTGVVNYNILSINNAKAYISNIQLILNNPKQFWRGY